MAQERTLSLPAGGLNLETITQALERQFPQYRCYKKAGGLAVDKSPLVGVQIALTGDNTLNIQLKDPGSKGQFWHMPGAKVLDEVADYLTATFYLQDDAALKSSSWRRWLDDRSWAKIFILILVPLVFSADCFYQVWTGNINPASRQGNLLIGTGLIGFSIPCFSLTHLFGEILEPLFTGDWPAPILYNILMALYIFSLFVGGLCIHSGLGK